MRRAVMTPSIRNLDAPLGAEISGIDLSGFLAPSDVETTEGVWLERLVATRQDEGDHEVARDQAADRAPSADPSLCVVVSHLHGVRADYHRGARQRWPRWLGRRTHLARPQPRDP